MDRTTIDKMLDSTVVYDLKLYTREQSQAASNGWKLSIQGKTKEDSLFLWDRLNTILDKMNVPYKLGTAKRIALINMNDAKKREQGHKIMTIYIPNEYSQNIDSVLAFAEHIYSNIKVYKGWYDIKAPTSYSHYGGGVFFRNDRDSYGDYVSAN